MRIIRNCKLPFGEASALNGCRNGTGDAVGKHAVIALRSKPILQRYVTINVVSSAISDPTDRYSAHLIFGGAELRGAVSCSVTAASRNRLTAPDRFEKSIFNKMARPWPRQQGGI
jgi:hypothetical protein